MSISADNVYAFANYLLLASLVCGVISTYGIVASGKVRDEASKREIVQAQEVAAKASERAANLEKDAALAKLESEKLKAEMAWRHLTVDQANKLISDFGSLKGLKIQVQGVDSDPEAAQFHSDIYSVLTHAGIDTSVYTGIERVTGLWIVGDNDSEVNFVIKSFKEAGIEIHRRKDHAFGPPKDKLVIVVGSKPPIFFTSANGPTRVNWYEQAGREQ